jgi:outer membrane receptor for ferrienterochelin and colicin
MHMKRTGTLALMLVSLLMTAQCLAQNTGKITGKVTDAATREELVGANVSLEGTSYGASTNVDGEYVIIKVPSGIYTIVATYMGYRRTITKNVQVLNDLTTRINLQLSQSTIALNEEVVVIAETPMIKKDLTSTESRVTSEEIKNLPVESVNQLIGLQAGVSRGADGNIHIRGGRSSEIAYLVNGISMTDDYSRTQAMTVETESIQELQVISGTFNAEYGNAMSGVVNVVTKAGGSKFLGGVELWTGDYLSTHKDVFWGIDRVSPAAIYNVQGSIGGPIIADQMSYFIAARRSYNDGYLYGINRYTPQGRTAPGDGSLVSMSSSNRWSGQATISWQPPGDFKLKLDAFGSLEANRFYNHLYRLNPEGNRGQNVTGAGGMLALTHQLSATTIGELTIAYKFNERLSRLYDDPFDPRYVHPDSLNVTGYHFLTAGTNLNRFQRNTRSMIAKLDVTSQLDKHHLVKGGVEVQFDKIFYENITLIPARNAAGQEIIPFVPSIAGIDAPTHDRFERTPIKLAVYVQDKIELESMIINLGLRFELFDPQGRIPVDQQDPNIHNPNKLEHIYRDLNHDGQIGLEEQTDANTLTIGERELFWYRKASRKYLLSPRLGIAYPITDRGIIRFSYGIFQQIPEYSQLYLGDEFKLTSAQGLQGVTNDQSTQVPFGNNDLKPQRTTIYELGIQQQFTDDIAVDATAFYRDIRDWVSSSPPIPTTQAGVSYSERINRDFANVRGVTVSLKKRLTNSFSFGVDYTFQVAEGTNSTSDGEFFSQLNGSEPTRVLTALDWDQTHTLNASIFVGKEGWGVSLLSTLNSGQSYTPNRLGGAYTGRNVLTGLPNNSRRKPMIMRFDLEAYNTFELAGVSLQMFVRVLNLFDDRNPINVWGDTGKPDFTLQVREINEYDPGWFDVPTYYSEPRTVYVGTKISL